MEKSQIYGTPRAQVHFPLPQVRKGKEAVRTMRTQTPAVPRPRKPTANAQSAQRPQLCHRTAWASARKPEKGSDRLTPSHNPDSPESPKEI